MSKPGRNDPCTCRSGKKFKKCCIDKLFQGPIQEKPKRKGSKIGAAGLLALAYSLNPKS